MASSKFLYVNLPSKEGFFLRPGDESGPRGDESPKPKRMRPAAADLSTVGNAPVFYVVTLEPGKQTRAPDPVKEYVDAALALHKVCSYAKSQPEREKLGWILQPSMIIHGTSAQPNLERCLVSVFSQEADSREVLKQWRAVVERLELDQGLKIRVLHFKLLSAEEVTSETKQVFLSTEIELDALEGVEPKQSLRYIQCDGPQASPSPACLFDYASYSPVFKNFDRVLEILGMCEHLEPVKGVLKIAKEQLQAHGDSPASQPQTEELPFKFVVIEGLDGAGKTVLIENLKKRLPDTKFCYGLPEYLSPWRKDFEALPEILRRAYFSLGNYLLAKELRAMCIKSHVIVDRFWPSSTAYAIAKESSYRDLPPTDHEVYHWPDDLLRPSVVLFLTVSQEERSQRMAKRCDLTEEEKALDSDLNLRYRLCEAYRRVKNPACTEIDANGSEDSVLEKAQEVLKNLGIGALQMKKSLLC